MNDYPMNVAPFIDEWDHMKNIGIHQQLCTRSYFEHKYMNNIKNIYQHTGKCDYQQNLKDIIDADMVSTQ